MTIEINKEELLNIASSVCDNAYAPYSKFLVGAAAIYEDGKIYKGCNVENASYGLALCAERNAISSAIADGQKGKLIAVAITSNNIKLCYPCGACRQWIREFNDDARIILEDNNGEPIEFNIAELLPYSFELEL